MKLHELKPAPGSRRERQRVGRGMGAGQGKTSGKGQKGQRARTAHLPVGFEGGQLPLSQRLPKLRGFHNHWRQETAVINIGKLNRFNAGDIVDGAALARVGLLPHPTDSVKVLGSGDLKVAVTLRVLRISAAARRAVEAAGGTVELLDDGREARAARQTKRGSNPTATKPARKAAATGDNEGSESEE